MNHQHRLEKAKTIKDLYDLRSEFSNEWIENCQKWRDSPNGAHNVHYDSMNEARFFLDRVETQILYLEKRGVFLNNVGSETQDDSTNQNQK